MAHALNRVCSFRTSGKAVLRIPSYPTHPKPHVSHKFWPCCNQKPSGLFFDCAGGGNQWPPRQTLSAPPKKGSIDGTPNLDREDPGPTPEKVEMEFLESAQRGGVWGKGEGGAPTVQKKKKVITCLVISEKVSKDF